MSLDYQGILRHRFFLFIPVERVCVEHVVCFCFSWAVVSSFFDLSKIPRPLLFVFLFFTHITVVESCILLLMIKRCCCSLTSDTYGQAASNLVAGSNLEQTIQQIMDMGGGNWDRETVTRALRAAYNNPERAVDYLYSVCLNSMNFLLLHFSSFNY